MQASHKLERVSVSCDEPHLVWNAGLVAPACLGIARIAGAACPVTHVTPRMFYVDLNGNDANPGTGTAPFPEGSNRDRLRDPALRLGLHPWQHECRACDKEFTNNFFLRLLQKLRPLFDLLVKFF